MVEMDQVALEFEDDLFFADLSQRIALLIMDDDGGEAEPVLLRPRRPSSLQLGSIMPRQEDSKHQTTASQKCFRSLEGLSHVSRPAVPSPSFYEPAHGRQQARGTGVFIPQFSPPRRKHRTGGRKPTHGGGPETDQQQERGKITARDRRYVRAAAGEEVPQLLGRSGKPRS